VRTCRTCHGAVVDPGELVWWAGKFCHCSRPDPAGSLKDWLDRTEQARRELPPLRQLAPLTPAVDWKARHDELVKRVVELAKECEVLRDRLARIRALV
jgi:hypothetical protein